MKTRNIFTKLSSQPVVTAVLGLILFLAIFLRSTNLLANFNFYGDAGRDAHEVFKMVVLSKPILLGPQASVAGLYMGPFYYYFIAPVLILSGYHPIAPLMLIFSLSLIFIPLYHLMARQLWGLKIALVSSLLLSLVPVLVVYSRYAWNPSVLPILAFLSFYFTVQFSRRGHLRDIAWAGFLFGLGLQAHLSLMFSLPWFIWAIITYQNWRKPQTWIGSLLIFGGFAVLTHLSLFIFEVRHDFLLTHQVLSFIIGQSSAVTHNFVGRVHNIYTHLGPELGVPTTVIVLSLVDSLVKYRDQLTAYIFLTLMAMLAYNGVIHWYYWLSLAPFVVVLLARTITRLHVALSIGLLVITLGFFTAPSLARTIYSRPPRTLSQAQAIAAIIANDIQTYHETKTNVALYSATDPGYSAPAYRFLVERELGRLIKDRDEYDQTQVLYIIAERPISNPLTEGSYELSQVAPDSLEATWQVGETTVYKVTNRN